MLSFTNSNLSSRVYFSKSCLMLIKAAFIAHLNITCCSLTTGSMKSPQKKIQICGLNASSLISLTRIPISYISISSPLEFTAVIGYLTPPYSKMISPEQASKKTYFLAFLGVFLLENVSKASFFPSLV